MKLDMQVSLIAAIYTPGSEMRQAIHQGCLG